MRNTKLICYSIIFFLVFFSRGMSVFAEEQRKDANNKLLSVTGFYEDQSDMTANLQGSIVYDQNGDKCALIKIQTIQQGFAFSCGMMSPVSIQQKTGEIWLYVPYGIKFIKIQHPRLGSITYPISINIERARTYVMELSAANVVVLVEPDLSQQYLVLAVDPINAYVEIDGQSVENKGGIISKLLPTGKHTYSVSLADYHTSSGEVDVMTKKCLLKIFLKPAYGFLDIPSNAILSGATVFVDNKNIGVAPISKYRLISGNHELKIVRSKYKVYIQNILIEDEKTISINPELTPNYKTVTVASLPGADIWINGENVGKSPWSGELEYGHYAFECRMEGYRTSYRSSIVSSDSQSEIVFEEPTPIYGKISIESQPLNAKVYIDGKEVGETPLFLPNVLIGNHNILLKKDNYRDSPVVVFVEKDKISSIKIDLKAAASSYNSSKREGSNGNNVGNYGGNGASVGKAKRNQIK